MLRFSSSPTGDMNIGELRVAIFNYIISKQRDEDLIVRIDDIDKEKNIEGKDKEILDILELFGIEYTQVIHQSQNFRFHSAMALQLMHEKKAFSCFCSDEWLDKKREEAASKKEPYRYDDACANLPAELVIDNINPFTIRINKPTKNITIKDYIYGDITYKSQDIDSFIILKHDKTPTYDFACAVDDMLSDISLVIRTEEYMDGSPKQKHVRDLLNYDKKIDYAHLPTIVGEDTISIKSLLEQGFLPEAISNYLVSSIYKTPCEIFTTKESIEWINLEEVLKSSDSFDINRLRDINKEHLKMLDAKELSRYVGFADSEIGELAKIYLEDVSTTKELKAKIEPIFADKVIPKEFSEQTTILIEAIKKAPYFDEYDKFKDHIIKESSINKNSFSDSLRIVLTGAQDGPDISEIYKYLKNYIKEIVK